MDVAPLLFFSGALVCVLLFSAFVIWVIAEKKCQWPYDPNEYDDEPPAEQPVKKIIEIQAEKPRPRPGPGCHVD